MKNTRLFPIDVFDPGTKKFFLVAHPGKLDQVKQNCYGTLSRREASAQPAYINGLRAGASLAVDGRRTRSGIRLREKEETVK
jgi:hypothetical protein